MNIQEGLIALWNTTGLMNFVLPADPNLKGLEQILHMHGQWIMIFALPIMLLYNHKKHLPFYIHHN